jgi:hypothetical protein
MANDKPRSKANQRVYDKRAQSAFTPKAGKKSDSGGKYKGTNGDRNRHLPNQSQQAIPYKESLQATMSRSADRHERENVKAQREAAKTKANVAAMHKVFAAKRPAVST